MCQFCNQLIGLTKFGVNIEAAVFLISYSQ